MPDMYEGTATCKKQAKVRVTEIPGYERPIVEALCELHAPRLSDLVRDHAKYGIEFVMEAVNG